MGSGNFSIRPLTTCRLLFHTPCRRRSIATPLPCPQFHRPSTPPVSSPAPLPISPLRPPPCPSRLDRPVGHRVASRVGRVVQHPARLLAQRHRRDAQVPRHRSRRRPARRDPPPDRPAEGAHRGHVGQSAAAAAELRSTLRFFPVRPPECSSHSRRG